MNNVKNKIPEDAYAMIIGAMKCGTTSLNNYLAGHPEICPCVVKEPEFFSNREDPPLKMEYYPDLWNFDRNVHKYALEASTGYTKYPGRVDIPARIHQSGIKPRFIYIVRNPFDRIESHYNFMQKDESWGSDITEKHLINTSNYYLQLERYRRFFPAESILVLDFMELKKEPERLLDKTYCFLGISHEYLPEDFRVKNKTYVQSKFEQKLKKSLTGKLLHRLPQTLKDAGRNLLRPDKRRLTDSERNYIHNKLKDDMAAFSETYQFDVKKWGF